jgi:hypothetical protein
VEISNIGYFNLSVARVDREEAVLINGTYDRLAKNPAFKGQLLPAAITSVEQNLNPLVPYSLQEYGFETAKKARQWLEHKAAYLGDLAPFYKMRHYLSQSQADPVSGLTYLERLDLQQEDLEHAATILEGGDATYTHLYAALEDERQMIARAGHSQQNPFGLEREFAYRGLLNVIDAALDGPDSIEVNGHMCVELNFDNGTEVTTCRLWRHQSDEDTVYGLEFYDPDDINIDPAGKLEPHTKHILVETAGGIQTLSNVSDCEGMIEACEAVELIRSLSSGGDLSFERSGVAA